MQRRPYFLSAGALIVALIAPVTGARAATIDLGLVLSNSGYELGDTSQWTVTRPNGSYEHGLSSNFGVNLPLAPLNPCCSNGSLLPALIAPDGGDFVAVGNPTRNGDIKGKLAHLAVAQNVLAGDVFQITLWANRGRLDSNDNTTVGFPSSAPSLSVEFLGWTAGLLPTVTGNNDNWSRNATVDTTSLFANWGSSGAWASQTFTFTAPTSLSFVSLAIAGQSNNHDQYVAWDVDQADPIAPVPEPASIFLLGIGLVSVSRVVKGFRK